MAKRNSNRTRPREIMRPESLLSIIIPVYGRFDQLEQCLKALPEACQGIPYNVILVDNASPDPGEFYKSGLSQNTSVIQNPQNMGFPRACNTGAKFSRSALLLFLNTDVIMQPQSIANMVRVMDIPDVGIVGAKLLFPEGNQWNKEAGLVQHVGLATDVQGNFFHQFNGWHPNHPKVKKVEQVLAVTGACLMIRRRNFHEWGGFPEIYGMGTFEDVDLCLTAGANNYKVIVVQEAIGYHYTGATSSAYNAYFPIMQNKAIFMSRWMNRFPWSEWQYA